MAVMSDGWGWICHLCAAKKAPKGCAGGQAQKQRARKERGLSPSLSLGPAKRMGWMGYEHTLTLTRGSWLWRVCWTKPWAQPPSPFFAPVFFPSCLFACNQASPVIIPSPHPCMLKIKITIKIAHPNDLVMNHIINNESPNQMQKHLLTRTTTA